MSHPQILSSSSSSMYDRLPLYLVVEVLSRLPIKTIIHCRCVCKTWLDLLSGSEFVNLQLSRSPIKLIVNPLTPWPSNNQKLLKIIELEEITSDCIELHYNLATVFDHTLIDRSVYLLGSSNGLLLLNGSAKDNLFICNPIMGEYITLPIARGTRKPFRQVAHGFGFSSRDGQYKVISIYEEPTMDPVTGSRNRWKSEIQVYTLGVGGGSWRSIADVYLCFNGVFPGVQLNGYLHWLTHDPQLCRLIFSFDLHNESFQLLAPPPGVSIYTYGTIGVLDNCLCVCNNVSNFEMELWIMKEYGVESSWNKKFVMSRPNVDRVAFFLVNALKTLEDGVIVFRDCYHGTLFFYHPEKKKVIKEYKICCVSDFQERVGVLSFLSLEHFAGEEVNKF